MNYKKLYTGKGNGGTTDIYLGDRVLKTDQRISVVGEIDFFHASLGLCHSHLKKAPIDQQIKKEFLNIQFCLTKVMGEVVSDPELLSIQKIKKVVNKNDISVLKAFYDFLAGELEGKTQKGLAMYGERGAASAQFDFATTICRKCELELWRLRGDGTNKYFESGDALEYFNLLSKVLYLAARLKEI